MISTQIHWINRTPNQFEIAKWSKCIHHGMNCSNPFKKKRTYLQIANHWIWKIQHWTNGQQTLKKLSEFRCWMANPKTSCMVCIPTWLVGGLNPSEKYESQLGWLFPIYGKIKFMATKPPTRWVWHVRGKCWHIKKKSTFGNHWSTEPWHHTIPMATSWPWHEEYPLIN